jgi:hypothetical protein
MVSVRLGATSVRPRRTGRTAGVAVLLGLWLGLSLVSGSEQLHHWLHDDSTSLKHECVVTLFSKSLLLAGQAPPLALTAPPRVPGAAAILEGSPISSVDYLSSPSRAPPVLFPRV